MLQDTSVCWVNKDLMETEHQLTCAALTNVASGEYLELLEGQEMVCTCGGTKWLFTDQTQNNMAAKGSEVIHSFIISI